MEKVSQLAAAAQRDGKQALAAMAAMPLPAAGKPAIAKRHAGKKGKSRVVARR